MPAPNPIVFLTPDAGTTVAPGSPTTWGQAGTLNEPDGFTTYTNADGSSKNWGADWSAAGSGARWDNDTHVQVVADASNPTGSGSVIEYRYVAGAIMNDYRHIYTHGGGSDALTELYLRVRFKYSDNYQISTPSAPERSHTKIFGYWGHDGKRSSYFLEDRDEATHSFPHRIGYGDQPPGATGQNPLNTGTGRPVVAGPTWNLLELHHKAQSVNGAGDGRLKVWADGVLVIDGAITQPGDPAFSRFLSSKMEFGPMRGHDRVDPREPLEETDYIRFGEFYMSGKE